MPACRSAAETSEAEGGKFSLTAPKPRRARFRSDRDEELPALPAQDSLEARVPRDTEHPVHDEIDDPGADWLGGVNDCHDIAFRSEEESKVPMVEASPPSAVPPVAQPHARKEQS